MSGPSGANFHHRYLVLAMRDGKEVLEFDHNSDRPRVAFNEACIRVGCHKISRAAFELLAKRYAEFIASTREEIMQEGNY